MSLNYTTYVSQLSNLMLATSSDPNFQTFLPGCIDYAEQRIYRELDLLATVQPYNGTFSTIDGGQVLFSSNFGNQQIVTVTELCAIVNNSFVSLIPTTLQFLHYAYPSSTITGVPKYFATFSQQSSLFTLVSAPIADIAYPMKAFITVRPTPLSSINQDTFLTDSLPDLFMAASLVFAFGYQRDFGAQSDDPRTAQSWENQYQTLLKSAMTEEYRKKFQSQGWTPYSAPPQVTPPRV